VEKGAAAVQDCRLFPGGRERQQSATVVGIDCVVQTAVLGCCEVVDHVPGYGWVPDRCRPDFPCVADGRVGPEPLHGVENTTSNEGVVVLILVA
jgi:hypothetical protein